MVLIMWIKFLLIDPGCLVAILSFAYTLLLCTTVLTVTILSSISIVYVTSVNATYLHEAENENVPFNEI